MSIRSRLALTDAVVVGAVRTPLVPAGPHGVLAQVSAVELLSAALAAVVTRVGVEPSLVDDVIVGCVTHPGVHGQSLATRAALHAGYPSLVPVVTVDRRSGSSQQAVHFAAQAVMSGASEIVVAAGMQTSSHLRRCAGPSASELPRAVDRIARDGRLSQFDLDGWAEHSRRRFDAARALGLISREIVGVESPGGHVSHDVTITHGVDEEVSVRRDGAHRAEGAAAVMVMTAERAERLGVAARALLHTMVVEGAEPALPFTTGVHATRTLLARSGLGIADVDVFAIHEPHAAVGLGWASELGVDLDRVNVHGGALAWGDPVGASGAVLTTALLHVLEARRDRFGVQVMASDGGPVNAMVLERLDP